MAMRLALEFRELDVDAMMEALTQEQYTEWCEFYTIDPFGSQRQDENFAALMTIIACAFGDKNATPKRFMLYPNRPPPDQKPDFRGFMQFMGRR